MWLGDNVVAQVWSFKNDMQDIPYYITRTGMPKKKGGSGVYWKCSCPSFVHKGGKTCKHLIVMRAEAKNGTLLQNDKYNISDFGKQILGI